MNTLESATEDQMEQDVDAEEEAEAEADTDEVYKIAKDICLLIMSW